MNFRTATLDDLSSIVALLADDELGKTRESYADPLPQSYINAFKIIDVDPHQELIVVENDAKDIIGTLQLTFIQYLNYQGSSRAQIESVRVRSDQRGLGIGKALFQWAIERAKAKNVRMVQLTSDKQRPKAIKFYEDLGFKATHEGLKLHFY